MTLNFGFLSVDLTHVYVHIPSLLNSFKVLKDTVKVLRYLVVFIFVGVG